MRENVCKDAAKTFTKGLLMTMQRKRWITLTVKVTVVENIQQNCYGSSLVTKSIFNSLMPCTANAAICFAPSGLRWVSSFFPSG